LCDVLLQGAQESNLLDGSGRTLFGIAHLRVSVFVHCSFV